MHRVAGVDVASLSALSVAPQSRELRTTVAPPYDIAQHSQSLAALPPPKTNMTMEHPPFEDVPPIEHGDVPLPC